MKRPRNAAPILFTLLMAFSALHSRGADEEKKSSEKAKDVLEKLMEEAKKAANKAKEDGKDVWARSKDVLKLPREEYTKKVEFSLRTMQAEIQALKESDAPVSGRDYFKTRVEALQQQLAFCQRDFERLKSQPEEEGFRAKQKNFERNLGWLGQHLGSAKEEAGL